MPHRAFLSGDSGEWQVWDVIPTATHRRRSSVAPGLETGWLCFERAGEKKRLAPIPEGWHEYGDADLRRCLERALPATPPRAG